MGKLKYGVIELISGKTNRHPKCKGYQTQDYGWGSDFDCEYASKLDCDECKYGSGIKDPEAKCNKL